MSRLHLPTFAADGIGKLQELAGLDVEQAQAGLLAAATIVQILDLEFARGVVEDTTDLPPGIEEELPGRRLAAAVTVVGLVDGADDVQVDPFIRGHGRVAPGASLQVIQLGERTATTGGLRLQVLRERDAAGRFHGDGGGVFPPRTHPGEHRADGLVRCSGSSAGGSRAQRRQLGTVVALAQPVLEAVAAVAGVAVHRRVLGSVDQRLAGRMRALIGIVHRRLLWHGRGRGGAAGVAVALSSRPFPRVTAFVRRFRSMIQAEGPSAGFASEGEEVELVAVFVLAVVPDGFEVGVRHLRE